ncbi:MAG: GTPase [Candidatus Micrarchaeota archaeon]
MRFKFPTVQRSQELLDFAFKTAREQQPKTNKKMRSTERYAKDLEKTRIENGAEILEDKIKKIADSFPDFEQLPQFYQELCDASFGLDETKRRLGHVRSSSKIISKLKRETIGKIFKSRSVHEIRKHSTAFYGRVSSVVKKLDRDLVELEKSRRLLVGFPNIQTQLPTVVLAGFPNVGKTTLLAALTGSVPEIAPYPFTTKGLKLGYIHEKYWTIQIIDTPGLLDRQFAKMNAIEKKALAAISKLADRIIFVFDPTWTSGFSVEQQTKLLNDMRLEFEPSKVWIAFTKTDLATPEEIKTAQEQAGKGFLVNPQNVAQLRQKLIEWAKEKPPQ